jgi:hypothetical protein
MKNEKRIYELFIEINDLKRSLVTCKFNSMLIYAKLGYKLKELYNCYNGIENEWEPSLYKNLLINSATAFQYIKIFEVYPQILEKEHEKSLFFLNFSQALALAYVPDELRLVILEVFKSGKYFSTPQIQKLKKDYLSDAKKTLKNIQKDLIPIKKEEDTKDIQKDLIPLPEQKEETTMSYLSSLNQKKKKINQYKQEIKQFEEDLMYFELQQDICKRLFQTICLIHLDINDENNRFKQALIYNKMINVFNHFMGELDIVMDTIFSEKEVNEIKATYIQKSIDKAVESIKLFDE